MVLPVSSDTAPVAGRVTSTATSRSVLAAAPDTAFSPLPLVFGWDVAVTVKRSAAAAAAAICCSTVEGSGFGTKLASPLASAVAVRDAEAAGLGAGDGTRAFANASCAACARGGLSAARRALLL